MKHTRQDLAQMQSLPLEGKIRLSKQRIEQWYEHFDGQVYVSFSGGKDSTVLLHLVRSIYPEVEAVFCDTGLEYPEIRDFVKTIDNVTWLKPAMNFKEVIRHYGYPVVSKENALYIRQCQHPTKNNTYTIRLRMTGQRSDGTITRKGKLADKWKPLIDSPFLVSEKCCDVMKKRPMHQYEKHSHKKPIIGTMATESTLRLEKWLVSGCNAFENNRPQSMPLSFWTEQDIFEYLITYDVPYSAIYGDIVPTGEIIERGFDQVERLKTSGWDRTGCMFCMFGLQLEAEPNRFQRMKLSHPKTYDYCMKPIEQGGLGIADIIDYMNEHCNCDIKR